MILTAWLGITAWPGDPAQAAGRRGGRIEGVVTAVDTGAPVAGVKVWLDRVNSDDLVPRRSAITDESGRFVFNRVHPGEYNLVAEKEGYLVANYQQQHLHNSATVIVDEGTEAAGLQIDLGRAGRVSGRVLDEQGAPLNGVIVKLLQLVASGDAVTTTSVTTATTSGPGRYTLDGLHAGRYVLRIERRMKQGKTERLVYEYYQGASSWDSATAIEIAAGQDVRDLNLSFTPREEEIMAAGRIVDAQSGAPLVGVTVSVVEGSNLGTTTKTAADGSYRLVGMPAGRYTISAFGGGVGDGYESTLRQVELASGENAIDFELQPAPMISGVIEYQGAGAPPAAGDFMVSIRVGRNGLGTTYSGTNTFAWRGLRTGRARMGVGFSSLNYKLAGIWLGDREVTGRTFELRPGDKITDARIVITDQQD
jgi:5-hydroxyisourate hydrolase-like protein (transthyretin family)